MYERKIRRQRSNHASGLNTRRKHVPRSSLRTKSSRPPACCASWWLSAKPRPLPPTLLLAHGWKSRAFTAAGEDVGLFRRVLVSGAGSDMDVLKTLASAIAAHAGCVAVVIGDGTPVPVVVARAADVVFDAGAWVKQLTAACGGRGGGRPEMAQGGVSGSASEIVAFARDSVR